MKTLVKQDRSIYFIVLFCVFKLDNTAMEHCVLLNRTLLLLIITVSAAEATFVQNIYKEMEFGQNIKGKVISELLTESKIQCSERLVNLGKEINLVSSCY